jgi:hypothetical protein
VCSRLIIVNVENNSILAGHFARGKLRRPRKGLHDDEASFAGASISGRSIRPMMEKPLWSDQARRRHDNHRDALRRT